MTLIGTLLSLVGLNDLRQRQHAVRRNYPILGNLRYLIETIRPEIRQYLLEGDDDKLPSSPRAALAGVRTHQERKRRESLRHAQ